MKKLTFIGLGIMGYPMAGHLKQKGYQISVWNRSHEKAEKFTSEFEAFTSSDITEVVKDADVIIMCLGNDKSVEETVEKFLPFVKKGAILIDHTTASAELARKLYKECKDFGINFLDAPMTGGQAGAENGTLAMMCGGEREVFEKVRPVLESYTSKLEYFGEAGSGQICKMVNQICIAGIIQALAEGINFAEKSGIDAGKLFKTISEGAGGSWQMKNRHELMISKDYKENVGFPVEWMLKDLNICLDEAKKIGASLEITSRIASKYEEIKNEINPRFDTSSLILLMK